MNNRNTDDKQVLLVKKEFSRAKAYASEYEDKTPIAHFFNSRIRRVSEMLGTFEQGRVLDVGCGPARIAQIFRGKPIQYFGVDVSDDMIKTAIEALGDAAQFHFSLGSIEHLGFPDASFDVVLCLGVLEYVLDGHAAIREVERVLRPDGVLIATMLNDRSPYRLWQTYGYWKLSGAIRKLRRFMRSPKNGVGAVNSGGSKRPQSVSYGEKAFLELLTSGRMEVEDFLYYDFNIIPSPLDAKMPRVSVSLSETLEWLCRSKFRFLGTGFMAKCRKQELRQQEPASIPAAG